jgi:hypothetical protein
LEENRFFHLHWTILSMTRWQNQGGLTRTCVMKVGLYRRSNLRTQMTIVDIKRRCRPPRIITVWFTHTPSVLPCCRAALLQRRLPSMRFGLSNKKSSSGISTAASGPRWIKSRRARGCTLSTVCLRTRGDKRTQRMAGRHFLLDVPFSFSRLGWRMSLSTLRASERRGG